MVEPTDLPVDAEGGSAEVNTGRQLPPAGTGRARRLTRTGSSRRTVADTGRRHHIGDAPDRLQVLGPDGTVGWTRTSPLQLKDKSVAGLQRLAGELEQEMASAAADLDFESAAHLRDEADAVRAELGRRSAP